MTLNDFYCEHNCRNTCTALTRALQLESEIVTLSRQTLLQCDDQEIKQFITELAEESSEKVLAIMKRLNEIRARVHILDGIASSFDPEEGPKPQS